MKNLPETIKHQGRTYVLDQRTTKPRRFASLVGRDAPSGKEPPETIKHQGKKYVLDRKMTGELQLHRLMTGRLRQAAYEGWTSYPTWHVNLMWSNDQGDYQHWTETAQSILDENEGDKKQAKVALAELMEASVDEGFEALDIPMFYNALLGSAIEDVDFWEIAESWLADLEYEPEE